MGGVGGGKGEEEEEEENWNTLPVGTDTWELADAKFARE